MAADSNPVKYDPGPAAAQSDVSIPDSAEQNLVQPGITARELIAKVGNLKMPGDGFVDELEAVQAAQGLAEMPEWLDWLHAYRLSSFGRIVRSRAMKVIDKLTEADLAERLDEVLDRARRRGVRDRTRWRGDRGYSTTDFKSAAEHYPG